MKLLAHIVIFRAGYIPGESLPAIDRAVGDLTRALRREIKAQLGQKAIIRKTIPLSNDFHRDVQWIDKFMGGRLWIDIHVDASIVFDEAAYQQHLKVGGETSEPSLRLTWDFVGLLDELIPICVLASNIAAPGVLRCLGGGIYVEGRALTSISERRNSLRECVEYSRELGWPVEIPVTFDAAYRWVRRTTKRCPDIGTDRVARALAAFSHIAISALGDGNLMLFWAMMGLEALYCDGSGGLKRQLFDKLAVIFGPLTKIKKIIRSLYDFRSAFVHGSTNIPYAFSEDYDAEEVHGFHSDVYKAESIAFFLLLVSLQWLVKNRRSGFAFAYKLV